jgi:hypothetical protein
LPRDGTVLFVSLDDLYFSDHSLLDLASKFTLAVGKKLMLDEIHKYSNWSREVKLILIIRYFASRQKRQEYNWQQIDIWAFRSSVFPAYLQAGVFCPNKQRK